MNFNRLYFPRATVGRALVASFVAAFAAFAFLPPRAYAALDQGWLLSAHNKPYFEQARSVGCEAKLNALVRSDLMTLGEKAGERLLSSRMFENIQFIGTPEQAFRRVIVEPLDWFQQAKTRKDLDKVIGKLRDRLRIAQEQSGLKSDRTGQNRWMTFSLLAIDFHACFAEALFNGVDLQRELGMSALSTPQTPQVAATRPELPDEFLHPVPTDTVYACNLRLKRGSEPTFPSKFEDADLYWFFKEELVPGGGGDKAGGVFAYSGPNTVSMMGRFGWVESHEKGTLMILFSALIVSDQVQPMPSYNGGQVSMYGTSGDISGDARQDLVQTLNAEAEKSRKENGYLKQSNSPIWFVKFRPGIRRGSFEGSFQQSVAVRKEPGPEHKFVAVERFTMLKKSDERDLLCIGR